MDVKKMLKTAEEDFRETGANLFKRYPSLQDEVLELTAVSAGLEVMKLMSGDVSSFEELQKETNVDVDPRIIADLAGVLCPENGYMFINIKPRNDGKATMRCFYSWDNEIAERVLREALKKIRVEK